MKLRLLFTPTVFLLLCTAAFSQNNNLVFTSSNPSPGSNIAFEYDPAGTPLADANEITPAVYIFDGQVQAIDVPLTKNGNKWSGVIPTNDSTKAILIGFKNDAAIDNNKEQGYSLLLTQNGEPVKGARAGLQNLNGFGSAFLQMDIKPETSLRLFEEEFEKYPDQKAKYAGRYAYLLMSKDKETGKQKIDGLLKTIAAKPDKTEDEYVALQSLYTTLKDTANAERTKKEIAQKFPGSAAVKSQKMGNIFNEKDPEKRLQLFEDLKKEFPAKNKADSLSYQNTLNSMYTNMAFSAGAAKKWDDFNKYLSNVTQNSSIASICNETAWALSGQSIEGKGDSLSLAKALSEKCLEYTRRELQDPTGKPPYYTKQDYIKNLEATYGNYEDTYALILWKIGEKEEAYKTQAEAVERTGRKNPDIVERYLVFKEALKGTDAVKDELEVAVKDGSSTPTIKAMLKKNYTTQHRSETGFTEYMNKLLANYRAKIKANLLKEMIKEPAPKFALKDLKGNTVSLAALKGKIVVVDFWATWCGPCRASFPGMQTAQNSFKNDATVKFLFVDTREGTKPEEMKKKAADFIGENKYNFHVLLDTDNKVIENYAAEGIPTKFLIDKNGNIRFKIVGFGGNADELVEEMKIMVDVIKTNG